MSGVAWLWGIATLAGVCFAFALVFTVWVLLHHGGTVVRIFQTKPMFLVSAAEPVADAEPVTFNAGTRQLVGSYLKHTGGPRRGVILFCHEYLADRWLAVPYVGYLRESGFDLFTFDFCNHGSSEPVVGYEPLQWTTEHEVADVLAAVSYLQARPDAGPAIGLFGVSKGGSAGLVAAAREPAIRAIVTDGAFPTHATVTHYEMRWIEIYSRWRPVYERLPRWFYGLVCEYSVRRIERQRGVRYARVESAMRRLRGRPLLLIHGQRDNYIHRDIVRPFAAIAGNSAELWMVKGAKHNLCLEVAGGEYRERVRAFFENHLGPGEPLPAEEYAAAHPPAGGNPPGLVKSQTSAAAFASSASG